MNTKSMVLLSLLWGIAVDAIFNDGRDMEERLDHEKTLAEYLASYGYNFEVHKAVTEDGYLITLWRIPKKIKEKRGRRHPILLQHGVMDNAFSWLYKSIHKNLATILVDLGYDVWLGNNRGTIHSLEHVDIRQHSSRQMTSKYWDFSFDEMGQHDFPTMVDYILDATAQSKLTYIGHSQGTAQFFVKSMLDPSYINKNIAAFIGLAPVLYVEHTPGSILQILDDIGVADLLYNLNLKNFWTFPILFPIYEKLMEYFPSLLPAVVQTIAGKTANQTLDLERVRLLATSEPGGTSTQNLLHWIQLHRNGGFKMMDFGIDGNMEKYGQPAPPAYDVDNLRKLDIPIILFSSKCDNLVGPIDLIHLMQLLPKNLQHEEVEDYGHLDFIWADDAHVRIYPQILKFIHGVLNSY